MTPTRRLHESGQSLWLDYIRRSLLTGGRLARYLEEDGLRGMTSNPSIFQQAIGGSDDYDEALAALLAEDPRAGAESLYESLAIEDIRLAADALRRVFDESGGDDGYVSLEVSPYLAYDTPKTIAEVRRLWKEVDRPNLMLKVPATPEGIRAIETLIGEGININVTLMFSMGHYEAVARAYLSGLEKLAAGGDLEAVRRVASVASFFVSRVDAKVDPLLDEIGTDEAKELRGTIAVANSRRVYQRFQEIFHGSAFADLRDKGARVQRVLWGSTSTKDPAYSDVKYVEELIGPETVNTLPPKTIDAFRDHGEVRDALNPEPGRAQERLAALGRLGVDLERITDELQREGVASFADSFDDLLAAIEEERRRRLAEQASGRQSVFVGRWLEPVKRRLQGWQDEGFGRRLWAHDRSLWSDEPVDELLDRLGWLTLADSLRGEAAGIAAFAAEAARDADQVVLLGMGGSSLAPEVFQRVFGAGQPDGRVREGYPRLEVLDSTHPEAVTALAARVDPARTLFVVSSKSGTTAETLSLFRWCWKLVSDAPGVDSPGRHFVAITDPGSKLAAMGEERGFRRVFLAPPEVGGRYSALTPFGLVPAALIGIDPAELLDRARAASFAFGPERPALVNEALTLGAAMGELALHHRDKLTFFTSVSLAALPDWMEQLIAESTGKEGQGVVPVVGESADLPPGDDRAYCALVLDGDPEPPWEGRLQELERAGHPVVRIRLSDPYDLGGEMLRWEIAVAAAGAVLGVQPFDQPDVELAKKLAKEAMAGEAGGPAGIAADAADLPAELARLLDTVEPGDYVSVHAYLPPREVISTALARLQYLLGLRTARAVTVGYGPRFLHSTGQLHKGGPDSGIFLQLVDEPGDALPVPEADYSFGKLIRGQAEGDRRALEQRGRRLLTVRLGEDREAGLERLVKILEAGAPPAP